MIHTEPNKKYSILLLTIGIPGAGKSTWIQKYIKHRPKGTFVISTDQIRKELTGVEQCINPRQNPMIHDEARKRAKHIIDHADEFKVRAGGIYPLIIIDSTNVDEEEWKAYKQLGATLMVAKVFPISPDEAFEHIKNRERKIDMSIIKWKYDTLQKNLPLLPKYFNMQIFSLV